MLLVMLLVLFREVVTSTAYINILRLQILGEMFHYLQANQVQCISVLTTWNGLLAFNCQAEKSTGVGELQIQVYIQDA
jgi:hypothetical protein